MIVQPDLLPPFPTLQEGPRRTATGLRMGEALAFGGHHLHGDNVSAFTQGADRTLELWPLRSTCTGFQVETPPESSRSTR